MEQQFAILSAPHPVDQDDVFGGIPIVAIVRRELKMPFSLAGVWIQCDDRICEQVVAGSARGPVDLSSRVADCPIQRVQIGIERTGQPHRTSAVLPTVSRPRIVTKFAGTWNRMPSPHPLSRCRVIRIEKTGRAELAAANADDNFIFYDERRARDAVSKHRVRHLCFPYQHSCPGIDGDDRRVERADEHAISQHSDAAVVWVNLIWIFGLPLARELPDLRTGLCVHCQNRSGLAAGRKEDRKSTRLNSSHDQISYAVFCLKKKKKSKRNN